MSVSCDYGPDHPARWHVQAVGDAPDLLSSRFACGGEHLDQAKSVVGTGGREYTVTELTVGLDGGTVSTIQPGTPDLPLTAAEKFEQFDRDNPAVYETLCRLARQWIARTGRRQIGIKALTERCRWEIALQTNDPEFKINNNFTAFYARKIMRSEPDLSDIFELRRSQADEWLGLAS